ncbi:unnamed protein product, partial [Discosporangium mesarthrocarpum]
QASGKSPKKIPISCKTRWWSYYYMLSTLLEYRYEVMSTIGAANQRPKGPSINIRGSYWDNAEEMCKMLGPFAEAVELIECDKYITLSYIPCLMEGLNAQSLTRVPAFLRMGHFSVLAMTSSTITRMAMVEAEIARFWATPGLELDASGDDVFAWWAKHQHGFPYLARLAVVHLAIPATSATSARVFSGS